MGTQDFMVRNLWAAHIDYSLVKCAFDSLLDVWESDNTQSLKVDIILRHNVRLLPHNWIIFLQLIDSVPQILLLCWDSFHLCFSILHHPLYLKKLKKKRFLNLQFYQERPCKCESSILQIVYLKDTSLLNKTHFGSISSENIS